MLLQWKSVNVDWWSISLTPIISKVFGAVISDQLRLFLESKGLLSDRQSGFQSSR